MGIERERPATSAVFERIKEDLRGRVIRSGLERIIGLTTYEFPLGYTEMIQEAALKGSIVVIMNHLGHVDPVTAAVSTADIREKANKVLPADKQIPGFVLPLALSLETGTQGQELSMLYHNLLPVLTRFRVEPILTPTEGDLARGRVTQEEYLRGRITFSRQMLTAVEQERKAILIAPEGSVGGGRIDEKTGKIKGLQAFTKGSMHQMLRIATSQYDNATIIPIGISGGNKIYDPQNNHLTLAAYTVGLGLTFQSLMSVRVGGAIVFSKADVKSLDPDLLDLQIGRAVAQLLPPEERGEVYAKAA